MVMGTKTGIEWTDMTWNPLRGCSRVSEGCRNCYAEKVAYRFSGVGQPYAGFAVLRNDHASWTGKVDLVEKHLLDPLKWNFVHAPDCVKSFLPDKDYCDCRQSRVFVNSMSDLFHEKVERRWQVRIFAVMAITPKHCYQALTKRPEQMLALVSSPDFMPKGFAWEKLRVEPQADMAWPLPNLQLGVSVENQTAADERIPLLLRTPAAVRFISAEPLLGAVNLDSSLGGTRWIGGQRGCGETHRGVGSSGCPREPHHHHDDRCQRGLDWVICGGESGPGARPMHPDWAKPARSMQSRWGSVLFQAMG